MGSYAYVGVGSTPEDIEDAGGARFRQACSSPGKLPQRTHWACLHGAYVSGLREAARLTGDQSVLPSRHFTENRRWREMLQRAEPLLQLARKGRSIPRRSGRVSTSSLAVPSSAVFPPSDLKVLAMMFGRRSLADGEMLCREGDAADCVFAIAEGEIDVYLADNAHPVARRLPGDVVGEFGMFLPRGSLRDPPCSRTEQCADARLRAFQALPASLPTIDVVASSPSA